LNSKVEAPNQATTLDATWAGVVISIIFSSLTLSFFTSTGNGCETNFRIAEAPKKIQSTSVYNPRAGRAEDGILLEISRDTVLDERFWDRLRILKKPLHLSFNRRRPTVDIARKLPTLDCLRHLDVGITCRVDQDALEHIGRTKELWYLDLGRSAELDLTPLRDLHHLTFFRANAQRLTMTELEWLGSQEMLHTLFLGGSTWDDGGLSQISDCRHLGVLYLNNCKLNPADGRALGKLPGLEILKLDRSHLVGDPLQYFGPNSPLASISLHNSNVNDAQLAALQECSSLTWLSLGKTSITDTGIRTIANLSLYSIDISYTEVNGSGFDRWPARGAVSPLAITAFASRLNDKGLAEVIRMRNIVGLDISRTKVTDEGITSLSKLRTLWTLNLEKVPWYEEDVAPIRNSNPGLQIYENRHPMGAPPRRILQEWRKQRKLQMGTVIGAS